jgi:hypothetical protein
VDKAPLGTRAWVVQERLLSTRTLHFGANQLFWDCNSATGSEVFPDGFVRGTRQMSTPKGFPQLESDFVEERKKSLLQYIGRQMVFDHSKRRQEEREKDDNAVDGAEESDDDTGSEDDSIASSIQWEDEWTLEKLRVLPPRLTLEDMELDLGKFLGIDLDFVEKLPIKDLKSLVKNLQKMRILKPSWDDIDGGFSPCSIKDMQYPQKRWIHIVKAYSGCNLSFSKDKLVAISGLAKTASKDMESPYIAGMWRKGLEHYLLWKVARAMPAPKKDGTRGPSWSWASVNGQVLTDYWEGYFGNG